MSHKQLQETSLSLNIHTRKSQVLFAFVLACALVLSLLPTFTPARAYADEGELGTLAEVTKSVSSVDDINNALAEASTGDSLTLIAGEDFWWSKTVTLANSKGEPLSVTLTSSEGNKYTLTRKADFADAFISVPVGSSLTLKNITLNGSGNDTASSSPLLENLGALILGEGSSLESNDNRGAILQDAPPSNCNGGAVYNKGTLTINGAAIAGNRAESGGGIYNAEGATANYVRGEIADNLASTSNAGKDSVRGAGGGILNAGILNVGATDGSSAAGTCLINGNSAPYYAGGGIGNIGRVNIYKGAEITGNQAPYGGGIANIQLNASIATVTMYDGIVTSNAAVDQSDPQAFGYGGGVMNYIGGSFLLQGGTISNNTARYGAGVYSCAKVTVYDGSIAGNTASVSGGGLYLEHQEAFGVESNGIVIFAGGSVSGNSAVGNGGGIYVYPGCEVNATGGIVIGNTAQRGAAVYLADDAIFTVGEIELHTTIGSVAAKEGIYLEGGKPQIQIMNQGDYLERTRIYVEDLGKDISNPQIIAKRYGGSSAVPQEADCFIYLSDTQGITPQAGTANYVVDDFKLLTLTDEATKISVTGYFLSGSALVVGPVQMDAACTGFKERVNKAAKENIDGLYDIHVAGGYNGKEVSVTIPLTAKNTPDGTRYLMTHCSSSGYEEVLTASLKGSVTNTFKSLSPFAVIKPATSNNLPPTGDAALPLVVLVGLGLAGALCLMWVSRRRQTQ